MASTLVVLMCTVADGFLLHVVLQFARELRKGRFARAAKAVIPVVVPVEDRIHPKVIDITSGSHRSSHNPRHRRVS